VSLSREISLIAWYRDLA